MKNPFAPPAKLTCSMCHGAKRVEARKAKMGKGWKIVGMTCPRCKGKGKLPTR